MAKTRAIFRADIRTLLNEASPGVYTEDEINKWINDGQRDIAHKCRCIESTYAITTVISTKEYSYTGIYADTVLYGNTSLKKITLKQLGHIRENGTDPQFFYEWNNKVGIHPTPIAVLSLTVYTAIDSTDMVQDAATSSLPLVFQGYISLYGLYRGLMKTGKFAQAQQVYSIYIRELAFTKMDIASRMPDDEAEIKIPDKFEKQVKT